MQDESMQIVWVFLILGFILLTSIVSMVSCTVEVNRSDNSTILEMVKDGHDPMESRCAVTPSYTVCRKSQAAE